MKKPTIGICACAALLALVACGGGKSSNARNAGNDGAPAAQSSAGLPAARSVPVPNCGATKAVWVNLNTKAYHEPDDPAYGKTKHGEYLCPSQATAQGFHAAGAGGGHRHHRHHRKGSEAENG